MIRLIHIYIYKKNKNSNSYNKFVYECSVHCSCIVFKVDSKKKKEFLPSLPQFRTYNLLTTIIYVIPPNSHLWWFIYERNKIMQIIGER